MRANCQCQAIVWYTIERMAFKPAAAKKDEWLWRYVRTLPRLWGLQAPDIRTRTNIGFDVDFLNIACDYTVETPDRYNVTIATITSDAPACWYLHVDPDFLSESTLYNPAEDYPRQNMDRHLADDVQTVLDGMIFHPRIHAHGDKLGIVSELVAGSTLSPYEIRLGGGIENGYIFLTHLRYQFCLLSEDARQAERTRLVRLFTEAIRDRWDIVSAAELFDSRA